MIRNLQKDLRKVATPEKAKASSWFFKTGKGQYGYGDKFLGVTVPEQRTIAKKYEDLGLEDLQSLLKSEYHEERLVALFILVLQFQKVTKGSGSLIKSGMTRSHSLKNGNSKIASEKAPRNDRRKEIFEFYLKNTKCINNWDLVDSSAHKIVGAYLLDKDRSILYKLAKSDNLWERRIAIISTGQFIGNKEFKDTFQIASILLDDKHDLIQKAVGWMLREVGKRVSKKELENYLLTRYKTMPRTMLRYAIEHFPPENRQKYLRNKM